MVSNVPKDFIRIGRRIEFFQQKQQKSAKRQQNLLDALKDVQRTTPLRIVLPAESDDEQKEREYSNVSYNTKEGEHEEKSMLSANKNKSTKAGKIKLAESTLYAD